MWLFIVDFLSPVARCLEGWMEWTRGARLFGLDFDRTVRFVTST
jgi:hypothetical protein